MYNLYKNSRKIKYILMKNKYLIFIYKINHILMNKFWIMKKVKFDNNFFLIYFKIKRKYKLNILFHHFFATIKRL
jgi:hypothetical protein